MDAFAAPHRLVFTWTYALAEVRARADAADKRWRAAVDQELAAAGVFARVAGANTAIATPAFAAAMNAAGDERRSARDENDLAELARRILVDLGVEMTDVLIRLRRAKESELSWGQRRAGIAQLRLSAKPSVEAAQRAIDGAAAAGFVRPGAT